MSQHLVITAIGTDRPGMCNQIVHLVSSAECNILDSRIAIFGSECTLSMHISGISSAITRIESLLPLLGQDNDIITMTKRTTPPPQQNNFYNIEITVEAEDRLGLTEQFTQFFADKSIGLASLSAQTIDKSTSKLSQDQFHISITAKLDSDIDVAMLETEFEHLCEKLLVKGSISFTKNNL
ncbi:glycine cleavage system protein R [Vibrio marisflavi]|uniref:Glycine cleavage system transcriptional repressor n=1 Tax=Vibrio marisflavi CECT 7928 TaxID=634439 RepID=A0ABM9A2Y5_9VIBR|nr:ACT domain-containing protein [Vibrio marisflavi]CAH0539051.1 Glycine cleavage system transcriptional repressor [Vibrio marisflavi CECT 7928]